jgi:hypothetical protein
MKKENSQVFGYVIIENRKVVDHSENLKSTDLQNGQIFVEFSTPLDSVEAIEAVIRSQQGLDKQ